MLFSTPSIYLARKLWLLSALALSTGICIYFFIADGEFALTAFIISLVLTIAGSIPALVTLIFILPLILKLFKAYTQRLSVLYFVFFLISIVYGVTGGILYNNP